MVNKHNGTDRKVVVDKMTDLMGLKAINTLQSGMFIQLYAAKHIHVEKSFRLIFSLPSQKTKNTLTNQYP